MKVFFAINASRNIIYVISISFFTNFNDLFTSKSSKILKTCMLN